MARHALVLIFLFLGIASLPAWAARAPNFEAALGAKRDILVFYHGCDWNPAGERMKAAVWDAPAMLAALPELTLVDIDRLDLPNEAQKKAAETNKKALDKFNPWNYPALALFDQDGRLVAKDEGVEAGTTGPDLVAKAQKLVEVRQRRDAAWARAEQGDPMARANAWGQGLDAMEYKVARQHYQDIVKKIKELDKEGRTGYAEVYEYNSLAMVEGEVLKKCDEKKYEEMLAELDRRIKNPVRPAWQKQELQAMRYAVYIRWDGHEADAKEALRQTIAVDPKSTTATGARHLLELIEKKQRVR